jgi:hypothetical protein
MTADHVAVMPPRVEALVTDEIWRTDCRRLRSSQAAQRPGSTVSLRRRSSPEARIRQPSESDNRHSNNRRKPCCFFRRLRVRTALLHRCGKECRLIARPIQPRRVRRRHSRANSIVRSHKRQRARSSAIVTGTSPSFCAFARLVQELVNLSRYIMRLAHGTGQHSDFIKPRVPQPGRLAAEPRSRGRFSRKALAKIQSREASQAAAKVGGDVTRALTCAWRAGSS